MAAKTSTRRQFLEDSLLASAADALAAAGLPEAAARAAAPPPPKRRTIGPNDKIQMACIGVKGRGMSHVNGYIDLPDATVVAICDVDLNQTGRAVSAVEGKTGKKPKVYQDLRAVFDDPEVDAVSLALPVHWHTLASIWAMQAGKDVYVEKPVSHNVSEGRKSAEAARKYGRICQAGTQSRSSKAVQDAIAYIHGGKIGKVTLARGLCYKPRGSIGVFPDEPRPMGVNYDLWLGPAPQRPFNKNRFHYNWHWMWDYGTGDVGNQGIHQMDIARWALNKHTLPERVLSMGGRFGYADQGETPNTLLSFYDYGDAQLLFEVRGLKTDGLKGVKIGDVVYGTDGYVAFGDNYSAAGAFDNDGKKVATFSGGGNHFGNFIQAVRSRKPTDLNAPVEEGHLSSALCHLGNVSYRLGQPVPFADKAKHVSSSGVGNLQTVTEAYARFESHLAENGVALGGATYRLGRALRLDVKSETFGRDKEANALLSRAYRHPFVVPDRV